MCTKGIVKRLMDMPLPSASLEDGLIETPPVRLSRRLAVFVIGALSILCWAILLAIALAVWEFV